MLRYLDEISDETRDEIRKTFNISHGSELKDIEAIKEWMRKQPHLPEISSDIQIRGILRINKYSIELTKKKIDMYYTMRTRFPHIYQHCNPNRPEMIAYSDHNIFVPLPTFTSNHHRVTICKPSSNPDEFDPVLSFAWSLAVCEVRIIQDFERGDIFVVDVNGCSIGHLTKTSPMFLKQVNSIIEKAYTSRIAQIHFINAPSILDRFLVIFKSIINPKVAQRIHVHEKIEDLYNFVPRKLLPKDYGGGEKSLKELQDDLKAVFQSFKPHFDRLDTLKVDEKLRLEPLNDDFLGVQGNFKKLDVD